MEWGWGECGVVGLESGGGRSVNCKPLVHCKDSGFRASESIGGEFLFEKLIFLYYLFILIN